MLSTGCFQIEFILSEFHEVLLLCKILEFYGYLSVCQCSTACAWDDGVGISNWLLLC